MSLLPACVYGHHMHAVPGEARRECQNPLDLELQMLVSLQVDARNCTLDLYKSKQVS